MSRATGIAEIIRRARLPLKNEKAAQAALETVLLRYLAPGSVSREHALSPDDIPDFLVEGTVVVEVKLKGFRNKGAVYRQLERYAAYDQVEALILATNLAMGLPETINGKPTFVVSLGAAWL